MSRELDDEDRANLQHLMRLGDVLEHHTPQSIIDWNKALYEVPVKPTSKRKKKRRKK
jgi:hypothetical protein